MAEQPDYARTVRYLRVLAEEQKKPSNDRSGPSFVYDMYIEAANAIESLTAENERFRRRVGGLESAAREHMANADMHLYRSQIATQERDEARAALERAAQIIKEHVPEDALGEVGGICPEPGQPDMVGSGKDYELWHIQKVLTPQPVGESDEDTILSENRTLRAILKDVLSEFSDPCACLGDDSCPVCEGRQYLSDTAPEEKNRE